PQVIRLVQPGNQFRPVPGGHIRSNVVALTRKDSNVVSQQMQGYVLDGPRRARGGRLPILFRQAREENQEFSESRPEEIDDDDRADRVQVYALVRIIDGSFRQSPRSARRPNAALSGGPHGPLGHTSQSLARPLERLVRLPS